MPIVYILRDLRRQSEAPARFAGALAAELTAPGDLARCYDASQPGVVVAHGVSLSAVEQLGAAARKVDCAQARLPLVVVKDGLPAADAVALMKAGAFDVLADEKDEAAIERAVADALAAAAKLSAEAARVQRLLLSFERLTARERQVLAFVEASTPNRAIARELGISEKTVEAHRAHIMAKLGATSVPAMMTILATIRAALGAWCPAQPTCTRRCAPPPPSGKPA